MSVRLIIAFLPAQEKAAIVLRGSLEPGGASEATVPDMEDLAPPLLVTLLE